MGWVENIVGKGENAGHQGMKKFIFESIDNIIEVGKNASDYHHFCSINVFSPFPAIFLKGIFYRVVIRIVCKKS